MGQVVEAILFGGDDTSDHEDDFSWYEIVARMPGEYRVVGTKFGCPRVQADTDAFCLIGFWAVPDMRDLCQPLEDVISGGGVKRAREAWERFADYCASIHVRLPSTPRLWIAQNNVL